MTPTPKHTAGYSGAPLAKKLGIKPGHTVATLDAPAHYRSLLDGLPEGVTVGVLLVGSGGDVVMDGAPVGGVVDMVHMFVTRRAALVEHLARAKPRVKQDGMVWVSWPKKASKVPTDVTEDVIREEALAIGLVDVKVCAVDEVWSGLKLVRRLKDRA
ncbi:MAG: DUF3052 family protein [SAR202 cluster bacterium]|nr:DUF3052 family protein [SAR202 cluster bacterium]